MSYDEFVDMIRCAFHEKMEPLDIEAVLRRSTIIVNTNWYVYVRPAGTRSEHTIERSDLETKCFVQPAFVNRVAKWHTTGEHMPPDQRHLFLREEENIFRRALYPDRFSSEATSALTLRGDAQPVGRPLNVA